MNPLSRRVERKIAAYQNELIATHFAEVENMYAQVRGWAHDYRNHMQVLSAYAEKGDLAAIRQYRFQELFGRRTRLRNRLGALLAYFPPLLRLSLRH